MINNTSCWYCSVVYPKDWPKCPECNHPNANEDLKAALRELYPVIGDETDDDPYCQCGNDPYENEHDDCLRRINRLAFENGQLRFYLREAITSMAHAEVFISTREKMHQTGQELWHDLLTRMETCLNEKGERCAECGAR